MEGLGSASARLTCRIIVHGRVQGVGYRRFAWESACRAGVVGWAMNAPDGSVVIEAEGSREAVASFVAELRKGPPGARVTDLRVEPASAAGSVPSQFTIRREASAMTREAPADRDDVAAGVRQAIRDVPDFPKPGILFRDITPVLLDADLFCRATAALAAPFSGQGITHVVSIESRGFILGAPVAQALRASFVPVRKPGKLPGEKVREEYSLEYGTDALEMHADALYGARGVLVVDDVLATGGTAA